MTSSPGAHSQQTQSELHSGGGRVETDCLGGVAQLSNLPLQLLGSRAGGDPAGTEGLGNCGNLLLTDVRRRKRIFILIFHSFYFKEKSVEKRLKSGCNLH